MRENRRFRQIGIVLSVGLVSLALGFVLLSQWPGLGAQVASPLRRVIGNEGVAQLEAVFFTLQDSLKRWQYEVGWVEARSPWEVEITPTALPDPTPLPATPTPRPQATSTPPPLATPALADAATPTPSATPTASPTPSPTAVAWTLPAVTPFGQMVGEGVWQPYLYDGVGDVVAVRTFLQPDPERPFTLLAVVAFDLTRTRLHYVLGTEEPALPGAPRRAGLIPEHDRQPGALLAAFNGGFLGTHGEYGAMQDGLVALPAKSGYGTVTIDPNGRVQIGEWGSDIDPAADYTAWRQNARMVVHHGRVPETVYNPSIMRWGGSIDGSIVTWRSGIGISEDEQILYYLAGPSVTMPVLAGAMQAVAVHQGILLDINATWVHFTAVRHTDDQLSADPLFADGMETRVDRYLRQSARDFFYITLDEE